VRGSGGNRVVLARAPNGEGTNGWLSVDIGIGSVQIRAPISNPSPRAANTSDPLVVAELRAEEAAAAGSDGVLGMLTRYHVCYELRTGMVSYGKHGVC
jgi:hypothetical protein